MNTSLRRIATATALAAFLMTSCGSNGNRAAATSSGPATASPTTPPGDCGADAKKTTVAYKSIDGVPENALSLDIYNVPGTCDAPVWMWVHGGGYRIGDKANQVADKVTLARKNGWMFVSVNYRLSSGGAGSDGPGDAQYPDHYNDVAAAVAWVHGNIGTYGGDGAKVALFGHSAGADIVANVVVNPAYLKQHELKPTDIGCFAPLDTAGFDKARARPAEVDNWDVALGNDPTYAADTSATLFVSPDIELPPVLGVTRGAPGRVAIETNFLDTIESAGWSATRIDAHSLTHNQINTNIGAADDSVMTKPVTKFLTDCLAGG